MLSCAVFTVDKNMGFNLRLTTVVNMLYCLHTWSTAHMIPAITKPTTKVKYLNNRDILKQIHLSKNTYCSFADSVLDHQFDIILPMLSKINVRTIAEARRNRADRIKRETGVEVNPKKINHADLVFRITCWEHIPMAPKKIPKSQLKKQKIEEIFEFGDSADDPVPSVEAVAVLDTTHVRVNFPPFYHYRLDPERQPYVVGKSHWKGDVKNGEFSKEHGSMTRTLATMFIKLCERYATRSNWRGYCVDDATEALTQAGWKNIDTISEQDVILSYDGTTLAWSRILSIFRDQYQGLMHRLTSRGMDALITPGHKLVTARGLVPVELLLESDRVILMGEAVPAPKQATHADALVELAGWIVTEGCYDRQGTQVRKIDIYQNPGAKADRIRACLRDLDIKFSEALRDQRCITFGIGRADSQWLAELLPDKNLTMQFVLTLTASQRDLLITTMVSGDGWTRSGGHRSWAQKSSQRMDMFLALCTMAGVKTNTHWITDHPSFGKTSDFFTANLFSTRGRTTSGACVNMHGGKRNGRQHIGQGKITHPNQPTVEYQGLVWCPETEHGCFVARRAGKVYLTGNTYNEEMRGQALLQLSQIGLQFDESKSQNPFAYYTAAITNSFTRILNIEKKNQNIRDNILELNGLDPSWTRQNSGQSGTSGPVVISHDE